MKTTQQLKIAGSSFKPIETGANDFEPKFFAPQCFGFGQQGFQCYWPRDHVPQTGQ